MVAWDFTLIQTEWQALWRVVRWLPIQLLMALAAKPSLRSQKLPRSHLHLKDWMWLTMS